MFIVYDLYFWSTLLLRLSNLPWPEVCRRPPPGRERCSVSRSVYSSPLSLVYCVTGTHCRPIVVSLFQGLLKFYSHRKIRSVLCVRHGFSEPFRLRRRIRRLLRHTPTGRSTHVYDREGCSRPDDVGFVLINQYLSFRVTINLLGRGVIGLSWVRWVSVWCSWRSRVLARKSQNLNNPGSPGKVSPVGYRR